MAKPKYFERLDDRNDFAIRTRDVYGNVRYSPGTFQREWRYRSAYGDSNGVTPTSYTHAMKRCRGLYRSSSLVRYFANEKYVASESTTSKSREIGLLATYSGFVAPGSSSIGLNMNSELAPIWSELENRLLSEIDNQSVDLGAILAESMETSEWIASRALTIGKFAGQLLTGNVFGAFRTVGLTRQNFRRFQKLHGRGSISDRASAAWLEYGWAVMPFVSDVQTAVALETDPASLMRRVQCSVSQRAHISERKHAYLGGEGSYRYEYNAQGQAIYKLNYTITDPETVARKALGLNSVAASVWQIVPFSWLVDYVVDVSDYLRLRNATDGLSLRHGYRSVKITETGSGSYGGTTITGTPASGRTVSTTTSRADSCYAEYYQRTPIFGFPRPSLQVDGRFSLNRCLNLAAVATQLSTKR